MRADFLAVFVPGEDPVAMTGGEGLARDGNDLAYGAAAESLEFLALAVVEIVPVLGLEDDELRAVAGQLTEIAAQGTRLLAVLVVDVIPRVLGLYVTDVLCLAVQAAKQQ